MNFLSSDLAGQTNTGILELLFLNAKFYRHRAELSEVGFDY
jgi:hypothetical protein